MSRSRIAVLGGGLGAIAAAWELTQRPNWQNDYAIDVYQKGWRLGGKCASGRDAKNGQRILEHGLHCFWGFYDNAFGMLRNGYDELARAGVPGFFPSVDDAFVRLDYVHFIARWEGAWCRYAMHFPSSDEKPGTSSTPTTVAALGVRFIEQLAAVLRDHPDVAERYDATLGGRAGSAAERLETLRAPLSRDTTLETFRAMDAHDDARDLLDKLTRAAPPPRLDAIAADPLLKARVVDPAEDYRRYVIHHALSYALFMLKGLFADGFPTTLDAFSRFDDEEISAWLGRHGAPGDLLESPIVRGFYNSSFCHPHGNFAVSDLATGVSLRAILLMGFAYKGSFMWKMRAGMGDVVFAPMYELLRRRGVNFHFFHKVNALSLDASKSDVAAIHMDVQARTKSGAAYDPLVPVGHLSCWPSTPRYEQLDDAEKLEGVDLESDWAEPIACDALTLRKGRDFDHVVCGIPVAALRRVAAELVEASPKWRAMIDNVQTVRTQSVQVWVRASDAQTHWQDETHVMTDVYADPFNSVADMWQTLPAEAWPGGDVGGVVYFSTPMPDDPNEPTAPQPEYPREQAARVEESWRKWMKTWHSGVFGWLGDGDALPEASFYATAQIDADARYTLSVATSTKHRLPPDGSGFSNLFLAGDWTKSPLDLGCAENATMSGRLAGQAAAKAAVASEGRAFVEYPGMPVFPPPYRQTEVTMCELALAADPTRMQTVLDRYLNPCAGDRRFRALGRWVLLQTGFIAQNRGGPPDEDFGTASETSASFLVPCARFCGLNGPVEVGFFAPMIFVSHPLSLVAGREVLGMAKHLASFDGAMPERLDDTTMTTMGLARRGADEPIAPIELIRVQRSPGGAPQDGGRHPIRDLLADFASARTVTFFCLRQLRDLRDPSRASSSELVRGRLKLGRVKLEPLAGAHTIEIARAASHPIADLFGFAYGPLTSSFAAKIHVDEATLDVEP